MPWLIKLIMFICVVPTALLMFFIAFPANPSKKKMIFGVRDNPKFHEGDAAKKFNSIASSCRRSADWQQHRRNDRHIDLPGKPGNLHVRADSRSTLSKGGFQAHGVEA